MKTLLVAINAKYIHTNLAVRYLYAYCKDDYDLDFIEFTIKDQESSMIESIDSHNADLICFSCYIWNIEIIKSLVIKLKHMNKNIKILLGGPEVSYDIKYFFNVLPIDYIISGEGEYPFKLFLDALIHDKSFDSIGGFHYRKDKLIYSNNNEYIIDIDCIPTPYRFKKDIKSLKNRIQYIESSRGCPFKCSYCLASLENNVRYFNIDYIKNEIRYLMKEGAKVFKFLDRTFNTRRDYALDMFQFIIDEHYEGCVFQFEITGEVLDEAIINYLNKHAPQGLIRFEIGVQSTNDLTNKLILRKQDFSKLSHNIRLIQKGGKIDLHLDLIAGLPKEDYKTFIKTFNDVFSLEPEELQLGFLKMLRGTKIRNEHEMYHYKFHKKAPYEIISNDLISEEELHKIHLAEEMLEKYYNSHRFNYTLPYIFINHFKENPYLFFESLGLYWNQHYEQINYQLHDLCIRLLEFWKTYKLPDYNLIESLLIYDYIKNQKTKPKKWYQSLISRHEKSILFNKIVENQYISINLDTLYRYALVEKLNIHPKTYQLGEFYFIKLFAKNQKDILILNKHTIF